MKISRLYITIIIATLFFVACDEYEDTVVPSPTVAADNPAARFVSTNATSYELDPAADLSFSLTVVRDNGSNAIEVPVNVITNTENGFVIPSSVSFAAGEDTTTLTIEMSESAPTGQALDFAIAFGEDYVNPYKSEYGSFYGEVSILVWVKYAVGTFESAFFEQSWTQELYNAEGTNKYRFYDLYVPGYNFDFTWDGDEELVPSYDTDGDGYYIFATGYNHPSYGPVTMHIDNNTDWTYYNEESDLFVINASWRVSAGAFGWLDDFYTITERF